MQYSRQPNGIQDFYPIHIGNVAARNHRFSEADEKLKAEYLNRYSGMMEPSFAHHEDNP